jgi:hypothetical protein
MRTIGLGLVLVLGMLSFGCSDGSDEARSDIASPEIQRPFDDAYIDEVARSLGTMLVVTESGTLEPLPLNQSVADALLLTLDELEILNIAIGEINAAVGRGEFIVSPGLENVTQPLALAALGFWDCFLKVLECSAQTAICAVAASECIGGCTVFCGATGGLGCVGCILVVCGDTIPACLDAYSCWVEYYDSYVCNTSGTKGTPTEEP